LSVRPDNEHSELCLVVARQLPPWAPGRAEGHAAEHGAGGVDYDQHFGLVGTAAGVAQGVDIAVDREARRPVRRLGNGPGVGLLGWPCRSNDHGALPIHHPHASRW
jgi:hypothetical protein